MKYYIRIFLAVVCSTGILMSCKKENKSNDPIKGKTWWGMLTYTGQPAEYYSVHFNADKSLVWTQLSGNYDGQWMLDGKHLTISFINNSVKIQADISDDGKLENITDNTSFYEINNGQLIPNPSLSLENTVWKGSWTALPYQITFLDGSKIKAKLGTSEYTSNYTRSASGAVIRFKVLSYEVMGVFTSDNVLKTYDDAENKLELIKQ